MNKNFLIAWVVLFIVWFAGSYVVHGVLLHDDYAQLANLSGRRRTRSNTLPG